MPQVSVIKKEIFQNRVNPGMLLMKKFSKIHRFVTIFQLQFMKNGLQ